MKHLLKSNIVSKVATGIALCLMTVACKEEIDTRNRYTFTQETVGSYLLAHDDIYHDFNYILTRSGKLSLLKAYGTYTCFAPTNEAVQRFLVEQDSIYKTSLMPGAPKVMWTGITSPVLEELSDSMCGVIARSHILPATLLSTEMEGDVVPSMNLNDRFLTMTFGVDESQHSVLYINGARIVTPDCEVENGVVHTVSAVLNPSTNTVPTQISEMPFLTLFSEALSMTGLEDAMQLYKDESYTDADKFASNADMTGGTMRYPPNRYFGYTAFCEPDEVFHRWGIYNIDDLYRQCRVWYPQATDPDFRSPDNALYRFMAYHLLNRHLLYTRMVFFNVRANSGGVAFNSEAHFQTRNDRPEYYETMQGTLLKVIVPRNCELTAPDMDGVERPFRSTIFLNYSKDGTSAATPFDSKVGEVPVNVRVMDPEEVKADGERYPEYMQEALNGSIMLIEQPLVYDEDVMAGFVLNGIIRIDYASLLPELTNNHMRWYDGSSGIKFGSSVGFFIPNGYSNDVKIYSDECRLSYYVPNDGYDEYEGDFCICKGQYDFAYRLPPVPAGTYELRTSYIAGSERGIVQFYVDDEITGIPVDNRIYADNPRIGYVSDNLTDDNGIENDKQMKNRGYLKLPTGYYAPYVAGPARKYTHGVRLVITTKYLTSGSHWLRIKNVHESDSGSDFYNHDYIELVPTGWLRREDLSLDEKRL